MTGPNLFAQFQDEEQQARDLYAEFQAEESKSAVGRKRQDEESRARLVAQYTESLKNPNLSSEHRARLQRGIEQNKSKAVGGILEVRRPEDEDRSVVENFGRGLGSGVVHGVTGLVDLAGATINAPFQVADAILPGEGTGIRPARALRDWAAESGAAADEVFDSQGKAGLLGDVAGSLVSAAPGYGKLAQVSGRVIAKVAPKLAPVVQKALTGNLLQRVTGQALIDAPLNVLQATTIEGATFEDKAKVLVLGTAGSIVGGALPGKKVPIVGDFKIKPGDADRAAALPGERSASRATEIADLIQKGQTRRAERAAQIKAGREAGRLAREQWAKDNPGKSWSKDISQTDRKDYIQKFRETQAVGTSEEIVAPPSEAAPVVEVSAVGAVSEVPVKPHDPPVMSNIKETASGDTEYEFEIATGDIVTIRGQTKGDKFRASFVGSTGGEGSVGARDIIAIKQTLEGITGTKAIEGHRISGAAPGREISVESRPTVEDFQQSVDIQPAINQQMLEDLSELPLYQTPEGITQAVAQIEGLPSHNKDFLDKIYSKLVKQAKEKTLNPGDAILLQNLQALDIHIFNRDKGRLPTIVSEGTPVDKSFEDPTREFPPAFDSHLLEYDVGMTTPLIVNLVIRRDNPKVAEIDWVGNPAREGEMKVGSGKIKEILADIREKFPDLEYLVGDRVSGIAKRQGKVVDSEGHYKRVKLPDRIPPKPASDIAARQETQSSPPVSTRRMLQTVDHDRSLDDIDTLDELDDLKDEVWQQMKIGTAEEIPASPAHIADLDALAQRTRELHAIAKSAAKVKDPQPSIVTRRVAAEPVAMTGVEFRRMFQTPTKKLNLDQSTRLLQELELRTASMASSDKVPYVAKMNELRSRQAELSNPARGEGPLTIYSRGEVGGGIVGFMAGLVTGDTDEERARNAMIGALVGAGSVYGATKLFTPKTAPSIVPKNVLSSVKTFDELKEFKPESSFMEKARWIYQRTIRPAHGGEHFTRQVTGSNAIPAAKDPGKMLASFGKWIAQSEEWIAGRPFIEDANGNITELPIKNAKEIADLVAGDTEGLGKLAAARTAIELYGTKGRKTPGIDLIEAQRLVTSMPENYHQAADEMRQLHLGMLESMVQGGVLNRESVAKMSEERYYAALERAFGSSTGGPVDVKKALRIDSPNPVKERGRGSVAPIKNPYETMIANISRTHRAVEINKIKNALLDLAEANPAIGGQAFKRVDHNTRGPDGKPLVSEFTEQRVETLKTDLDISEAEARALTAAYVGDDLNPTSPTMTVYRDGNLRTYRLRRDIAESMRALRPEEFGDIEKILGLTTSVARSGIVNNPVFIARQAWRDNWQAMVNSQYGFVWGLDWVRGYLESAFQSKNYKEFVKGGGGSTGFAFRDILSQEKAIQIAKTPGSNVFDTAIKRVKELSPAEAWHSLVVPVAEAARMGEYLRARGRGASVAEAVYAGKSVVGNFQQHGAALRALSMSALFLNPSLQALDQAAFAAGIHPFRVPESAGFKFGPYTLLENSLEGRNAAAVNYIIKGVAGITIPSLLLWAVYHDDQEITELRTSETGQSFWYWRNAKGEIQKSAKPIFEGQLFGTMAELAADKYKADKPIDAAAFASAMMHDAAVNLLPTLGVVGASLWANKDYNTGGQLASGGGTPQFQLNTNTSLPARVVSEQLGGISEWMANYGGNYLTEPIAEVLSRAMSPAGIDYVVRNLGGTLAQEALRGIGQSIEYRNTNYIPPAVEWPIIRGVLVNYPGTNTGSIQKFYRDAERVDRVAKDVAHLAERDPEGFIQYFNQHKEEIALVDLYAKTRRELADMRQAIQDMKGAPQGTFQPQDVRAIQREIILRMIDQARLANEAVTLLK